MDGWGWPPKAGKGEKGKKKKKNHYLRNNWVRLALTMGQNEVLRFLVPLRVARAYHHHHRHALRTGRIGELRGENSDRGDYAPRLPFFFFCFLFFFSQFYYYPLNYYDYYYYLLPNTLFIFTEFKPARFCEEKSGSWSIMEGIPSCLITGGRERKVFDQRVSEEFPGGTTSGGAKREEIRLLRSGGVLFFFWFFWGGFFNFPPVEMSHKSGIWILACYYIPFSSFFTRYFFFFFLVNRGCYFSEYA